MELRGLLHLPNMAPAWLGYYSENPEREQVIQANLSDFEFVDASSGPGT